jgi:cytoskeletal protein CcmA (bactofilin family)
MWWEKKGQMPAEPQRPKAPMPSSPSPPRIEVAEPITAEVPRAQIPRMDKPMNENMTKAPHSSSPTAHQTLLGGSVVLRGDLSADEDLAIEGQFDGSINLKEHTLTVGQHGKVKADISARQVVVSGVVEGKISAKDKIDIRRTGHVIGDLLSAGVAIEEGAYFKGSIEIQRDEIKSASKTASSMSV